MKKIAHLELESSKDNRISVRKLGNEQTDKHTRNLKLFGTNVQTLQEYFQKFEKDTLSRTKNITDDLISVRKLGNEQTD